jgi:phenylalanyl-tRNA synthetase beta chain
LLAARGYHEVINFGFVDPVRQRQLLGETRGAVLQNPIASDLAVMRESLWTGLLNNAAQNQRRQQERSKLFEIATCFATDSQGKTTETLRVAGLGIGARLPEQWDATRNEVFDFFDLKADVEALLSLAGPTAAHQFVPLSEPTPALHPGRSAEVRRDGARIGLIGELHPTLVRLFDLNNTPVLFELDYQAITTAQAAHYEALSPFPQVRRDLSFTVDASETFSRIAERVSVAASAQLKELRIFDVYSGNGIENGRKSIALGLILQDLSRTLTDKEADEIVSAVVASLQSGLNARLRE